ncbi:MAG: hemerythrin domain-containing protein [Bacteroidales bacterium]
MTHSSKKTLVRPGLRMSDLVFENPALLRLMEHMQMDFLVHDHTVSQVCAAHGIREGLFIMLCNLYNGHHPATHEIDAVNAEELTSVVDLLKQAHRYYTEEQYPAITKLIKALQVLNSRPEIGLVETFFAEYFAEVLEHLNYEDEIAFPYIIGLTTHQAGDGLFSVKEYLDHHTDIESKLSDLKALLLQHIEVEEDRKVRRMLLIALTDLETDLEIHSLIEEQILIPVVERMERSISHER